MAAEPRLRQEGFHTHPQRLQIILHASRSSPGPAAAFKAVGGLARGVNVLLDTNVLFEPMRERPDTVVMAELEQSGHSLQTASLVIHDLS